MVTGVGTIATNSSKPYPRELRKLYTNSRQSFRLVSYLVRTRNAIVSRKLVEAYESQPPGAEVKVFCVSNALYKEKRKRSRDISLPYLTLSGILDVRKHCISIVSNSQHRIASHYMCELVPALLAEVELWVQSGADTLDAEQRAAVRSTISTLENRLSTVSQCLLWSLRCHVAHAKCS